MNTDTLATQGNELREAIRSANHLLVLTGAGISTESGIPDFRSPGGIWSKYRTVTIQEFLANHEARIEYWRYKKETFQSFHTASPNIGHKALVQLERQGKLQTIITQNIDGLHQQAGNSPEKVIELHGSGRFVVCLDCGERYDRRRIQDRLESGEEVPVCDRCNGWLKPATVSFGQSIPSKVLDRAYRESENCEAFLVVGSSLVVQPASLLPVVAKQKGAWLGILNRDSTAQDSLANWVCHYSAGKILSEAIATVC